MNLVAMSSPSAAFASRYRVELNALRAEPTITSSDAIELTFPDSIRPTIADSAIRAVVHGVELTMSALGRARVYADGR